MKCYGFEGLEREVTIEIQVHGLQVLQGQHLRRAGNVHRYGARAFQTARKTEDLKHIANLTGGQFQARCVAPRALWQRRTIVAQRNVAKFQLVGERSTVWELAIPGELFTVESARSGDGGQLAVIIDNNEQSQVSNSNCSKN